MAKNLKHVPIELKNQEIDIDEDAFQAKKFLETTDNYSLSSDSQDRLDNDDPTTKLDRLVTGSKSWGWYMAFICFTASLVKIPSGMNALVSNFILAKEDFRCESCLDSYDANSSSPFLLANTSDFYLKHQGKCSIQIDKCLIYKNEHINFDMTDQSKCHFKKPSNHPNQDPKNFETCKNYIFNHEIYESTATADFKYVCENSWLHTVSTAVFYGGFGIGGVVGGYIGDRCGRKYVTIAMTILLGVSDMITAYLTSSKLFILFRFLNGFFLNAMMIPGFTICMEFISLKYRGAMGMWFCGLFAVGTMLLSYPFAVTWTAWRDLQFWISLSCWPTAVLLFFTPESYKWLISKSRVDEAFDIAYECMRKNRSCRSTPITSEDEDQLRDAIEKKVREVSDHSDSGLMDLFKNKNMLPITLNCCYNWFVCSIGFYGCALNAGSLPGSIYFNNFVMGFMELPAFAIFSFLVEVKWLGRTRSSGYAHILGGVCCLLSSFALEFQSCQKNDAMETIGQVLAFMGKFFFSGAFGTAYSYTAEIYPAEIRSIGVGVASFASRMAGLITPFILALDKYYGWLPGAVFAFFGITCGMCAFRLPETLGRPLLATMDETDELYFSSKNSSTSEVEGEN